MKKNRIIALLLALLTVVGTVPGTVFAQEDTTLCEVCQSEPCICESTGDESGEEPNETTSCEICGNDPCTCEGTGDEPGTESDEEAAPKCDCNLENGGTHVATCPNYVCPNCGGLGYHDVCPETGEPGTDSGEEPGETTLCEVCGNAPCTCESTGDESGETTICETCGSDPCTCENTGDESGEDPSCDFSCDVGKYAQFVEATDTYTVRNGVESSEDLVFYYSDFEEGTVLRITDWYLETETRGLWYQIEFYSGGIVEEYADLWPDDAWILQDYLDENYEYDPSLEFVSITCDICGEEGCTKEHIQCEHCGQYDCTVQHTYCGGCGALDCPTVHIACPICQKLDCGVEHEPPEQEDYTPPTAPVIPDDPQLPEEYSVVITDEFGVPVTESGFTLNWSEKASLSAWSALGEDVSYQWQIFIDEGEGYWVDVTGQTGKGLLFSRAMLMSALDDSGCTQLRCVTESDGEVQTSDVVCVTILSNDTAGEETEETTDPEVKTIEAEEAAVCEVCGNEVCTCEGIGEEPTKETEEESAAEPVSVAVDTPSLLSMRSLALSDISVRDEGIALINTDTETVYVTVTIHYWTADSFGKDVKVPIFEPYVANILKGSAFNTPVVSPTYLGYAAFYDRDGDGTLEEEATSFNPGLGAVNEDTVFNLYYQPIEVPIAIRYFFQNINDDDYTENTAYYYSGMEKTGTIVSDAFLDQCLEDKAGANILKGFSKMHHNPEAVAADGSTVFECYYDRNYFMISLALDGGYGVEPIYARYEAPVLVNNPVKPGHTFQYWDQMPDTNSDGMFEAGDGAADSLPTILPAENRKYAAIWTESNTTYTAVYWLGSADGADNTYLGSAGFFGATGDNVSGSDDLSSVVLCGMAEHTHTPSCSMTCGLEEHSHDGTCPTFDASRMTWVGADKNVEIKGDGSTIVNVYYKYKDYTLRFYYGRSSGTGDDAVYEVVGGTTWPFGGYGKFPNENTTVETLLSYVTAWGEVTGLTGGKEDFNDKGQGRIKTVDNVDGVYTLGTTTANGYTYYYLQFTAPYMSNLKDLWPVGIFDEVDIVGTHSQTSLKKAYFSAWNGEYKVKYTQDKLPDGNQTVKGLYLYLDDNLLFDTTQFEDGTLVSYLGFWENGANISWSIPELYEYKLWVTPTSEPQADDVLYNADTYSDYTDTYYSAYEGYVLFDAFDVYDDSSTGEQTATSIKGYDDPVRIYKTINANTANGMEHYIVNYFYGCDNYTLTVQNYGSTLVGGEDSIAYGTPLRDIMTTANGFDPGNGYAPDYPTGSLEEGGYYFEGWYTTEEFSDGTKVEIDTAVMPDDDLILYARWLPRTHTVQFFYNLTDLQEYNSGNKDVERYEGENGGPRFVLHGKTVSESDTEHPLTHPDNDHDDTTEDEHMSFVRWFYLESGKKVAFSPDDTLIKKDLNVYAEWRDKRIQSFRISYALLGNETTKIADDEFGYAYMSSTRTFTAKAGDPENELYDAYATGYFPINESHSMIMQYEPDLENPMYNLYTFKYTKATDVTYTIRYINAVTGAEVSETAGPIDADGKNVVTVRYKAISGYTPDAFYKRLVLSVKDDGTGNYVGDDDANVITFYYTPSTTSARYVIHYMTENLTGGTYSEDHSVEGIGTVDALTTITPTVIPGFALIEDKAEYHVNGVKQDSGPTYSDGAYSFMVKMEGSELYLYFKRLSYDYAVYYYLYNTTTLVNEINHPSVAKYALYGASVTETAPDIADYTCVSAQKTVTITVREESAPHGGLDYPLTDVTQNKIIFYYMPKQYIVDYVPIPTAGGKIFPSTRETITGAGAVAGVTWAVNQYYEFEGWFMDEACTQGIDGYATLTTVDGVTTMVPDKGKLVADDGSGNTVNTFYAKFELLAKDFTITRTNAAAGQVFVYRVENADKSLSIDVTIQGTGSVTIANLPFGDYTVTQLNRWSWRYNDAAQPVTHGAESSGEVSFGGNALTRWLNGISNFWKNIFGGT